MRRLAVLLALVTACSEAVTTPSPLPTTEPTGSTPAPTPPPTAPPPTAPASPPPAAQVDTIFAEGFEGGTLGAFDDGVDSTRHRVVRDAALARAGERFLEMTYPAGSTAGWLTRFFMPGYDSLYVRYHVRFEPAFELGTKLLRVRGSRVDDRWSAFGRAGLCPTGSDWFATGVVATASGSPGPARFYTYYPEMQREPGGVTCYGRHADPAPGATTYDAAATTLGRDRWHRIEVWVKLNTPGVHDGEQRMWVDGVLAGTWTGLLFRTTTDLRLNSVMIDGSLMHAGGAPRTQRVLVDELVVLTGRPG